MTATAKLSVLVDYWKEKFESTTHLGLQGIFWGDQDVIPSFPSLAIEPVVNNVIPTDTGFMVNNELSLYFLVYHSRIAGSQETQRECAQFAESVQDFVNADKQLGGLITHGWIRNVELGYATRASDFMRAARLTWTGLSHTRL